MEDNLKIWSAVSATDPKKTKGYKGPGGFQGTSINPTYLIQKATELWGPCGGNWGYEIVNEGFTPGAPILNESGEVIAHETTHTLLLNLRHPDGNVSHFGHTPHIFKNKYGIQTDHEAAKKSLTDAIKKCLGMLGFAADVMLGDFENPAYVEMRSEESRIENAANQIEEKARVEQERAEELEKVLNTMESAQSIHELQTLYKLAIAKLQLIDDQAGIKRVVAMKDTVKAKLEEAA